MKYRHSFHAGNFADIHKHVTLLALLAALKRKDKGFAYFETHAGRGSYDLSNPTPESRGGVGRFDAGGEPRAQELRDFAALLARFRASKHSPHAYPGSPLIAALELRSQDRGVLSELLPTEARLLERELEDACHPRLGRSSEGGGRARLRVERGDGFEQLRAGLPPRERRGLVLIDPPYEESHQDLERVRTSIADALQRFATGVYVAWYPIKDERDVRAWHETLVRGVRAEMLVSELWLYPRDSKVALNGSGLLIVNPPYQFAERMRIWLPELQSRLDVGHPGGTSIMTLSHPA